ncbi:MULTISPECIES: DUF1905 domain-containing protein [Pseudovibrio]|uniref:DUF1905 domain-containing protein n=1 Tax=Stappiaceae TaxID=2821832 RepID=UPI0023670326|nr:MULTISPECIES: DUF1905 domain-containing protein [Pseudovibrio]MDD7911335.1 DUF1905 domain-containing protein [Pseudovibrio exalbescens]MDX5592978.1 DUF1905 domain-containing protein [Pseudovibrio sp. SPO723]
MLDEKFHFTAPLWIASTQKATWHFITLPKDRADQIRFMAGDNARGWGSVPVTVTIGGTSWKTSIFPDKKQESYILPIKAEVRKVEGITTGDEVRVHIALHLDA